jgi:hypothetical protein
MNSIETSIERMETDKLVYIEVEKDLKESIITTIIEEAVSSTGRSSMRSYKYNSARHLSETYIIHI